MGNNNKKSSPAAGGETINGAELVYELRRIMRSYFPDLQQTLSQTTDCRKRKDYRSDELITAAAAMFIFKAQSRNAVNNDRRHSGEFTANFQKLFKTDLPHLDAVQDFFETLPPAELEQIKVKLVSRLLENKVFCRYKILGHYMVAVDASGVISCDEDRFGCEIGRAHV